MAYIEDKLGKGEKVVYLEHQHPFVLLRASAGSIVLFIIGVAALVGSLVLIKDPNLGTLKNILLLAGAIAIFVALLGLLIQYLLFVNEEFIVTNERVIVVSGILNKRETDASLSKINDVQTNQSIWGRMFHYGTVNIETGNDSGNPMSFLNNPIQFKKNVLDAKSGYFGDASDEAVGPGGVRYIQTEDGRRIPVPVPGQAPQAYPPGYPPMQPPGLNRAAIPAMIQELARLRDAGIISPQEFEAKKTDLLRQM